MPGRRRPLGATGSTGGPGTVARIGEQAPHWVPVSSLDELWAGEMAMVVVDGVQVVLLNIDGEVVAFDNRCPHAGSPLAEGRLEGAKLICAAHEWEFDSRTGKGVNPASACLRPVRVRVDDDVICLDTSVICVDTTVPVEGRRSD